jgi:hypothetical protein
MLLLVGHPGGCFIPLAFRGPGWARSSFPFSFPGSRVSEIRPAVFPQAVFFSGVHARALGPVAYALPVWHYFVLSIGYHYAGSCDMALLAYLSCTYLLSFFLLFLKDGGGARGRVQFVRRVRVERSVIAAGTCELRLSTSL